MNKNTNPLVSIGLPVFNEEYFLKDTLESLTNQTYANIELIISDNASSDRTPYIIREFCKSAPSTKIKLHSESITSDENYRYVLSEARGEYFMFGSGHDLWDKELIAKLVNVFLREKNIILAVPGICKIDSYGASKPIIQNIDTRLFKTEIGRANHLYKTMVGCNPFNGLFKRHILIENNIIEPKIVNDDFLVLMRTAKCGNILTDNSVKYYRRDNRGRETAIQKSKRVKTYYFLKSFQYYFPNLSSRIICFKEFLSYKGSLIEKISFFMRLFWRFFISPFQILILAKEIKVGFSFLVKKN